MIVILSAHKKIGTEGLVTLVLFVFLKCVALRYFYSGFLISEKKKEATKYNILLMSQP